MDSTDGVTDGAAYDERARHLSVAEPTSLIEKLLTNHLSLIIIALTLVAVVTLITQRNPVTVNSVLGGCASLAVVAVLYFNDFFDDWL